jgi:S-formylglutathione hydrolase FrmB
MGDASDDDPPRALGRRRVLLGLAGVAGVAAVGGVGLAVAPDRLKERIGLGPDPFIPDAPEGRVRLEHVRSEARGSEVELFTAVPAGHGAGRGLPVVVILHGASATPADYRGFGFGRFLTRAVQLGAPPFVLAGAEGGRLRWERDDATGDDPHRMVVEELPEWLAARGFDADRRAVWGWSMGGFGALRLAETDPDWMRATAAFSPAIAEGDPVFEGLDRLDGSRLGVWCGDDDPFRDATGALVRACRPGPAVASFSDGGHTRAYWNDHTLAALRFLATRL